MFEACLLQNMFFSVSRYRHAVLLISFYMKKSTEYKFETTRSEESKMLRTLILILARKFIFWRVNFVVAKHIFSL